MLWVGSGVLNAYKIFPPYGYWWLEFPLLLEVNLGSIPTPDGVLELPCFIPSNLPVPIDLPLQARIGNLCSNLIELKIQ